MKKFISLTQTDELTAIYCLNQNDWKLDLASDNYFQNPSIYFREVVAVADKLDRKRIEQMFMKYRDTSDPQKITTDGIIQFLHDLNLSPESKLVLIIAWRFNAETQCEFTRDEFCRGMQHLGVDSIEKLKQKLPALEAELNDLARFKDFYQFTFNYAKETTQKSLDLESAIAYWNIVMRGRFKFIDLWCQFLRVSFLR